MVKTPPTAEIWIVSSGHLTEDHALANGIRAVVGNNCTSALSERIFRPISIPFEFQMQSYRSVKNRLLERAHSCYVHTILSRQK